MSKLPVTEIYAPVGARLKPRPTTKWQRKVIRFVRLYPRIIIRATGERKRVNRLMNAVVMMNSKALMIINAAAAPGLIKPEGISLFLVLGLRASNFLSTSLLKPIAALRAKIMQRIISKSSLRLKLYSSFETASEKPISAKGIAKTVWLNLTNEK